MTDQTTDNQLLGGRVQLLQPAAGYRVAIDPVLLAAACPVRTGDWVLELGAGTGAASLCLAARAADVMIDGLEVQPDIATLFARAVVLNRVGDRVRAITGDLLSPPSEIARGHYDLVMANPPYRRAEDGNRSPNRGRDRANVEGAAGLRDWVGAATRALKPRGRLVFIHAADRLDDLMAALRTRFGEIVIFPLWPAPGQPAKRVIVAARLGVRTPLVLSAGLTLHLPDGNFTPEAELVLREGEGLELAAPRLSP